MMLLLAISMVAGIKAGNASRYGYEGDTFDRVGSFACKRTLHARYGERGWQKMRGHGVAHRTLACGTRLGICNLRTNQCTTAYVVDRGPWGVLDRKGEWHLRTSSPRPGEHYRGDLDLLPGTYSAIALTGIERVAYWPINPPESSPASRNNIRLPPLRAGGRLPFAVNLRAPSEAAPPMPPLRDGQPASTSTMSSRVLALNVPINVNLSPAVQTIYPPLRSPLSSAEPPLRLLGTPRRR